MTVPPEHVVRDYLAVRLDLLEPGLRLHATEFRLQNPAGTRGSIDILAYDRNGMWVIIEVKRDKRPSREAVSEVAKYIELLSRDRQVNATPDRIRAIIASPDWTELLAPVSYAAREWSTNLRGYLLVFAADGTVARADRVELLGPPGDRFITPVHVIYFFATPEGRDHGWAMIKAAAADVGAPDLLAAVFDRTGHPGYVVERYGLYLGFGTADPAMIAPQMAGPCDEDDKLEPFAQEYPAEYRVMCHITHTVNSGTTARSVTTIETAVPGTLHKIGNNPVWEITGYVGAGAFAGTGTYGDEDLYRFLSGDRRGQSQITFEGSANPRMKGRWVSFRAQARTSLGGNRDWDILIPAWLESVADHPGDIDVWIKIYNPCDLVATILFGWPHRLLEYMPLVNGHAKLETGGQIILTGELCWDGRSGVNVPEHLDEVYRDPRHWVQERNAGMAWLYDRKLLKHTGLRYLLHEVLLEPVPSEPSSMAPREWAIWIADGGKARRATTEHPDKYYGLRGELNGDGKMPSVDDYLAANPGQVDAAVRNYRYYLHMPPP